ncbi:MAG: hypothetical protein FWG71_01230 [Synergistaceae bacterium]|nr:hypothetical protein [Synergistaceae bacterium]
MAGSFNIHIEKGCLRIDAQIPLACACEEIEAFIHELKIQLLGDKKLRSYRPLNLPPQELSEKDAARYIGRTVSFLRGCRYAGKTKMATEGQSTPEEQSEVSDIP